MSCLRALALWFLILAISLIQNYFFSCRLDSAIDFAPSYDDSFWLRLEHLSDYRKSSESSLAECYYYCLWFSTKLVVRLIFLELL